MSPGTPSDIRARGGPATATRPGGGSPYGGFQELPTAPGARAGHEAITVSLPTPDEVQYPQAEAFYLAGNANVALGVPTPLASFQIPVGMVGIGRSVVLSVVNLTTADVVDFWIRANTAPVAGWDARRIPSANASSAIVTYGPDETWPRFPQGGLVQVGVTVQAGGPVAAEMQLAGWYYPQTLAARFRAAWEG